MQEGCIVACLWYFMSRYRIHMLFKFKDYSPFISKYCHFFRCSLLHHHVRVGQLSNEVVACFHLHLRVMDVLLVAECSVQRNASVLRIGWGGVFSRSVLFHFTFNVFCCSGGRRNLGFVWVYTQIFGSVGLCEFAQRFFNSCFHFYSMKEGC